MKRLGILLVAMLFCISSYALTSDEWMEGGGLDVFSPGDDPSDIDTLLASSSTNPLNRLLDGYVKGCTITVTDDEVLTISAGKVVTSTAGGVHRMRQNTSTTTVDNTVAGVGGLDTGALAADTWYYIYAVADADATTFTAIMSASAANPTNASALHYKLIGCALTDATSDWFKYYWAGTGSTITIRWDITINETAVTSAGAWSGALDCSSSIPSISNYGIFGVMTAGAAAPIGIWIRPNGSTFDTDESTGLFWSSASGQLGGELGCATDTSQQIQYYQNAADNQCAIDTKGFIFER